MWPYIREVVYLRTLFRPTLRHTSHDCVIHTRQESRTQRFYEYVTGCIVFISGGFSTLALRMGISRCTDDHNDLKRKYVFTTELLVVHIFNHKN